MPTTLSSVQQCLTAEASKLMDDAVAAARRKNNAQTTSLHLLNALLSGSSSSFFRDACSRSRFPFSSSASAVAATSTVSSANRLLDLCFAVALDRLPSNTSLNQQDPGMSNSLVAAIKRSQAIQRRFSADTAAAAASSASSFPSPPPLSAVKVELQQLVLSILDDPIVSRVMAEAGFRSTDVKIAIERPLLRRPPPQPLFLRGCDQFQSPAAKLAEIMSRSKKRNPLLLGMVGGSSDGIIREFLSAVDTGEVLAGARIVSLEMELAARDAETLKLRIEELGCSFDSDDESGGVVVNLGDLRCLVDCVAYETLSGADYLKLVVSEVTRLLSSYTRKGKMWVIGAATYEVFMQCQTCYPSIEDDWDLQPLPVSSLSPPPGLFPKSSLMGSFVPFGGFFTTGSESKDLGSNYHGVVCSQVLGKKSDEVAAVSTGSSLSTVEAHGLSSPSWLQAAKSASANTRSSISPTKDDGSVLSGEAVNLQKPADAIHGVTTYQATQCRNWLNSSSTHADVQRLSSSLPAIPSYLNNDRNFRNELNGIGDGDDDRRDESVSLSLQPLTPSIASRDVIAVTTELALGTTVATKTLVEYVKDAISCGDEGATGIMRKASTCHLLDAKAPWQRCATYAIMPTTEANAKSVRSGWRKSSDANNDFDPSYFKKLSKDLLNEVLRQEDAIYAISRMIVNCRIGSERHRRGSSLRGDIWFCFAGCDHVGKKRVAAALANAVFGSKTNFISINLSSEGMTNDSTSIFYRQEINGYDLRFRGKTILDHIAEELTRKPVSVVLLENLDRADMLVQNSLSQAIRTGKFADSHGREIGISNSIFVMTSRTIKGKQSIPEGNGTKYPEGRILKAKAWEMRILVEEDSRRVSGINHGTSFSGFVNKRRRNEMETVDLTKRTHRSPCPCFDLNVSLEEAEANSTTDSGSGDDLNESALDLDEVWMEDFDELVDETVIFEPFDFDALADNVLKKVTKRFHHVVGSDAVLEIDPRVMEQILAAVWLSGKDEALDDWVEHVVEEGFLEVREKYSITSSSVVKFTVWDEHYLEEQQQASSGVCLPAKIVVD